MTTNVARPDLAGTLVMYDSVDVAKIPATAGAVAGYVDGHYVTYGQLVAALPHAAHVSITVEGAAGARVLDWEKGNADPPLWASREIAAGRRPSIYCNTSSRAAVAAAIAPLALGNEVDWWAADWTGQPHAVAGAVATQYANDVQGCDLSLVSSPEWLAGVVVPADPVDTGKHFDATVPGYGLPGVPQLAVIGKMLGGGLYRGRNVAGGKTVYAGNGYASWRSGFVSGALEPGTPLAVLLTDADAVSTVVVTERL